MRMKYYSHKQRNQSRAHFQRAISLAGSQSQLAKQLSEKLGKKIYQAHVRKWLKETKVIPDYICKHVEDITCGQVTKAQLRPDLWSKDEAA